MGYYCDACVTISVIDLEKIKDNYEYLQNTYETCIYATKNDSVKNIVIYEIKDCCLEDFLDSVKEKTAAYIITVIKENIKVEIEENLEKDEYTLEWYSPRVEASFVFD